MNGRARGGVPYASMQERILFNSIVQPNGCWHWRLSISANGYGMTGTQDGRSSHAHRASYEAFVGPIPPGLQLDHLCHTHDESCGGGVSCLHRRCVNPAHLEPVTQQTNLLRGRPATKTHCTNGHAFTPENTYTRGGTAWRGCRICRNNARRKCDATRRDAIAEANRHNPIRYQRRH